MDGVYNDAIRHAYLANLGCTRQTGAYHLMRFYVDDTIGDGIIHRHLAPLRTVEIERIAHNTKIAYSLIDVSTYFHLAVFVGCQPPDA